MNEYRRLTSHLDLGTIVAISCSGVKMVFYTVYPSPSTISLTNGLSLFRSLLSRGLFVHHSHAHTVDTGYVAALAEGEPIRRGWAEAAALRNLQVVHPNSVEGCPCKLQEAEEAAMFHGSLEGAAEAAAAGSVRTLRPQ